MTHNSRRLKWERETSQAVAEEAVRQQENKRFVSKQKAKSYGMEAFLDSLTTFQSLYTSFFLFNGGKSQARATNVKKKSPWENST